MIKETFRRGRNAKESSAKPQEVHSDSLVSSGNSGVEHLPRHTDIRILAVAQSCTLLEVMSILCEGCYDPELRRGHIYEVLLTNIKATLDKIAESSQARVTLETKARPHAALRQQISTSSAEISEDIGNALVSLCDDPGFKRCYKQSIEAIAHPSAT